MRLLLKEVSDLKTVSEQTAGQIAGTQNRLKHLRTQIAKVPKIIRQGDEVDNNPYLINSLKVRLVDLELKHRELSSKYTSQNDLVKNVEKDIAMVKSTLDEQEKKRYGKNRSGVNTTYQRLEEEIFQNEAELKALSARQDTQGVQLAENHAKLKSLNRIETEFNRLEREVDVCRQNYRLYQLKFEESRIDNAMDNEKIANVGLIEPGRAALEPVWPKVRLNLLLGIILGAVGAVGLALFRECLDDSLEKPEQVEEILQLPVLGSIPLVKANWR
jgi:uncharacterized protein involved in exopolysaccharide biosynthesis